MVLVAQSTVPLYNGALSTNIVGVEWVSRDDGADAAQVVLDLPHTLLLSHDGLLITVASLIDKLGPAFSQNALLLHQLWPVKFRGLFPFLLLFLHIRG